MSDAPARPRVDAFSILAHGTSSLDQAQARRSLGLAPDADDESFAQALVRYAVEVAQPAGELQGGLPSLRAPSDRARAQRSRVMLAAAAHTASEPAHTEDLDEMRTLMLIVRAGSLFQRRAAVLRMGELLSASEALSSDRRKQAIELLTHAGRFDVAYETEQVLCALTGSEGRPARAQQRARQELATRVQASILAFWEGEHVREPFCELSAEERAMLLPRARELSDVMARHLCALLEDTAGQVSDSELRVVLTSLEHAGDPRLLPALRVLLVTGPAALYEPCVRALSSIDDPRVPGLLREAFERATHASDRLLLSAALGRYGDSRGLPYARSVLHERDPALLRPVLEALAEVGGTDDVARVASLLGHPSVDVVTSAVITLGRIGDGRALLPLADLASRVTSSSLHAVIEDAQAAIISRTELLGEAAPSRETLSASWGPRRIVASARTRDPALVRVRGLFYYGLACVFATFGSVRRSSRFFEIAAALRPSWLSPVLALALLHARRRELASALSAFRRALDIDRAAVEADERAISMLAMTYLRRAEAVEREGRLLIARGLVDEALSYDLRRASPEARLALGERHEAHSVGSRE